MNRALCFLVFVFGWIIGQTQETISIPDPNNTINFTLPEGWTYEDDGYYLVMQPENNPDSLQLSFTYFSDDGKVSLDTLAYIQQNFVLPSEEPSYQETATGVSSWNQQPCHWILYQSENPAGDPRTQIKYLSIQQGKRLELVAQAKKKAFEKHRAQIKGIKNSIYLEPNPKE